MIKTNNQVFAAETGGNEGEVKPEAKVEAEVKPEAEVKVEGEVKVEAKPVAKLADDSWKDDRIKQLTAKLREAQKPAPTPTKPLDATADLDRRVAEAATAQARQISAIEQFNKDCNAAAISGRETYGEAEFNLRLDSIKRLVDVQDPQSIQAYNQFLLAALDAESAPKIIFELGGNLNEAMRIMSMTPTKMAATMARLALTNPTQISELPKPVEPVGGRGARHEQIDPTDAERSDSLSTSDWMARRNKQIRDDNAARAAR